MEAAYPLEFGSVRIESLTANKILVTLSGRWTGRQRPPAEPVMLVVQAAGGRHEIPASSRTPRSRLLKPRVWSGSFYLPAWLESSLEGNTSLVLGDLTIQIPAGSFQGQAAPESQPAATAQDAVSAEPQVGDAQPELGAPEEASQPEEASRTQAQAEPRPETTPNPQVQAEPRPETSIAEPDPDQTIAALRAELERRTASEAAVRGELTRARAQLQALTEHRNQLDGTLAELRRELVGLAATVDRIDKLEADLAQTGAEHDKIVSERDQLGAQADQLKAELDQLRRELATSSVAREAALSEAAGLRGELDRLGSDLAAAASQQVAQPNSDLEEAQSLLAEARALRTRMRDRTAAARMQ